MNVNNINGMVVNNNNFNHRGNGSKCHHSQVCDFLIDLVINNAIKANILKKWHEYFESEEILWEYKEKKNEKRWYNIKITKRYKILV